MEAARAGWRDVNTIGSGTGRGRIRRLLGMLARSGAVEHGQVLTLGIHLNPSCVVAEEAEVRNRTVGFPEEMWTILGRAPASTRNWQLGATSPTETRRWR